MFKTIEKWVFIPAFLILLFIIGTIYLIPDTVDRLISVIYDFCTGQLGWLLMLTCLISFGFLIWLTTSKYGKVVLGDPDEKPQYKTLPWVAMLFTAGVGTSIVILGFLEPIYYLETPPFDIRPFTKEAYEYAHMYGQFHWGMSAWAIYSPAIVGIAYVMFTRKKKTMRLSAVCEPVLKGRLRTFWSHVIDVLVVFGIIGGISTSLGIGAPVVSDILVHVFNIPLQYSLIVKVLVLVIWMLIFGTSVYLGLDKGIQNLSNINIVLAFIMMAFILLYGPTSQLLNMEVNSLGLYAHNFFRMSMYTDPFGSGRFPKDWTNFYWAWFLAFMPMMGLFVGKISRGRTIRNVMWGQLLWGSLGCCTSFMIFGGYAIHLQHSGEVNVAGILAVEGQSAAIIAIIETFPFSKFALLFLCVLLFIYLATTIDSSAYVLAGSTTKNLSENSDPARWNRIFWAVVFCVLSIGLMMIGGLETIKLISVIAGIPLIIVTFLIMVGVRRMLREDWDRPGPAQELSEEEDTAPVLQEAPCDSEEKEI